MKKGETVGKPRARIVRTLDRIGIWTFITGSFAVIALSGWSIVTTVAALFGAIQPREESLGEQVLKSGVPPIFDEAHGAVVIIGHFQWFGTENPGHAGAQLYLWASLISSLTVLAIAGLVLLLCITILRGRPFTRTMTRYIGGAGLTLAVGGTISQFLTAMSHWVLVDALKDLGHPDGVTVPDPSWTIDFTPIAAGIVLTVIAAAFEIGTRLQRDTEGLV